MIPGSLSELKSRIDVREFLKELGVKNVSKRGVEYDYSCPFDGHKRGDRTPSASMRGDTTAFKCWGCGASGDAITFVALHEGVSPLVAAQWLRERFGTGFIEPSGGMAKALRDLLTKEKSERFTWSAIEPTWWEVDWDLAYEERHTEGTFEWIKYLLNEREFSPAALTKWEIGFSPMDDMIVIPLRNESGELVGAKGRVWRKNQEGPRYRVLGGRKHGFDPAPVGRIVFGSHFLHGGKVILREGELNTIRLNEYGHNAVGISGSTLTNFEAEILIRRYDEVLVWFDKYDDSLEAASTLIKRMPVSICKADHDPCELTSVQIEKVLNSAMSYTQTMLRSRLTR